MDYVQIALTIGNSLARSEAELPTSPAVTRNSEMSGMTSTLTAGAGGARAASELPSTTARGWRSAGEGAAAAATAAEVVAVVEADASDVADPASHEPNDEVRTRDDDAGGPPLVDGVELRLPKLDAAAPTVCCPPEPPSSE